MGHRIKALRDAVRVSHPGWAILWSSRVARGGEGARSRRGVGDEVASVDETDAGEHVIAHHGDESRSRERRTNGEDVEERSLTLGDKRRRRRVGRSMNGGGDPGGDDVGRGVVERDEEGGGGADGGARGDLGTRRAKDGFGDAGTASEEKFIHSSGVGDPGRRSL